MSNPLLRIVRSVTLFRGCVAGFGADGAVFEPPMPTNASLFNQQAFKSAHCLLSTEAHHPGIRRRQERRGKQLVWIQRVDEH